MIETLMDRVREYLPVERVCDLSFDCNFAGAKIATCLGG